MEISHFLWSPVDSELSPNDSQIVLNAFESHNSARSEEILLPDRRRIPCRIVDSIRPIMVSTGLALANRFPRCWPDKAGGNVPQNARHPQTAKYRSSIAHLENRAQVLL
jgi:hypothetical protein